MPQFEFNSRPRFASDANPGASNYKMDQPGQVLNNPQIPKDKSNLVDYLPGVHLPIHTKINGRCTASTNTFKTKADTEKSVDHSIGASNDQSCYSLETSNEDSDTTSSPTSDNEEEEVHVAKPVSSAKRRRINSEVHNLYERKRRENINKKMRALQALIPNSDKMDKASVLDNAIDYLKSLQLQLQLMTAMGSRLCMPPMTLSTMQQIQAANMMGMRVPIGVGFCPALPFTNPTMLSLFGGGMVAMPPASQPTFIPLVGGSSPLPMPRNSTVDLMSINNRNTVNQQFS